MASFNRSEIMKAAWAGYRQLLRIVAPHERREAFRFALKQAWTEARQTVAERRADGIRRELLIIDCQSGSYAKHEGERRRLNDELAAIAA